MQKMMQEVMARNIRGDSVGITTISITMCLQAREVHRNCSAPCDYIYTGRKQGSYTWAFIDIEGASDRTSRDITKAAKWQELKNTHTSDWLALCWVAEKLHPHWQEKHWRDLGKVLCAAVHCITPQLWSLVVDEIVEGPGNGCYRLWYALSSSVENSQILPHTFFRMLWVWNMHGSLLWPIFLYSILFYSILFYSIAWAYLDTNKDLKRKTV